MDGGHGHGGMVVHHSHGHDGVVVHGGHGHDGVVFVVVVTTVAVVMMG